MSFEIDISDSDKKRIHQAALLASLSECNPRTRHGCLIVKAGHTIAVGVNCIRNDPKQFAFEFKDTTGISIHAEEACLRALNWRAHGCTAYIARLNSTDNLTMSRPCKRCMKKLKLAGVNKICYTTYNGSIKSERI